MERLIVWFIVALVVLSFPYNDRCPNGRMIGGRCIQNVRSNPCPDETILKNGKCIPIDEYCPNGRKKVDGNCWRNILKCTSWESEHVCKTCENGYHLEWYGNIARICYPDQSTADSVCNDKRPACPYKAGFGWANDQNRGIPWIDCGDDADNVWWYIYDEESNSWVSNGKKGNPGC